MNSKVFGTPYIWLSQQSRDATMAVMSRFRLEIPTPSPHVSGFGEAEWPSCFAGPWAQQFEAGTMKPTNDSGVKDTLQGTNISPKNGILKMIFLFPRWDMLIPWRVRMCFFFFGGGNFPNAIPGRRPYYFLWVGGGIGQVPCLRWPWMFQLLDSSVVMFPFTFVDASWYDDSWWFYMYICRFCMILFRITHTQAFT